MPQLDMMIPSVYYPISHWFANCAESLISSITSPIDSRSGEAFPGTEEEHEETWHAMGVMAEESVKSSHGYHGECGP